MNGTKFESVQCVKDFGVTVVPSLKFSQQWKEAANKANGMLGFINRNFSFKNKKRNSTTVYQLSQTTSRICRAILGASPCKRYSETEGCPAEGYKDDYILAL